MALYEDIEESSLSSIIEGTLNDIPSDYLDLPADVFTFSNMLTASLLGLAGDPRNPGAMQLMRCLVEIAATSNLIEFEIKGIEDEDAIAPACKLAKEKLNVLLNVIAFINNNHGASTPSGVVVRHTQGVKFYEEMDQEAIMLSIMSPAAATAHIEAKREAEEKAAEEAAEAAAAAAAAYASSHSGFETHIDPEETRRLLDESAEKKKNPATETIFEW